MYILPENKPPSWRSWARHRQSRGWCGGSPKPGTRRPWTQKKKGLRSSELSLSPLPPRWSSTVVEGLGKQPKLLNAFDSTGLLRLRRSAFLLLERRMSYLEPDKPAPSAPPSEVLCLKIISSLLKFMVWSHCGAQRFHGKSDYDLSRQFHWRA